MLVVTVFFLLGVAGIILFVPAVRAPFESTLFGKQRRPLTAAANRLKGIFGQVLAAEEGNVPEAAVPSPVAPVTVEPAAVPPVATP
jgi:hypothetical protein